MDLVEQDKHVLLNFSLLDGLQSSRQVLDDVISVSVREDFLPKTSGLLEVRVGVRVSMTACKSVDLILGPSEA